MLRPYWILLPFMFPVTVSGQTPPVLQCASDLLDITFQGVQGPAQTYTLAISLRNISLERCSFLSLSVPGVDVADGAGVRVCYYNCETGMQRPPQAPITLGPGESVHQTQGWETSPRDGAAKCASPIDMGWGYRGNGEWDSSFWLYSRSLLKPICSAVITSDYTPGQFLPSTLESLAAGSRVPIIRWANDEGASYSRERIPLRVIVEDSGHVLLRDENLCPKLFMRERDATPGQIARLTRVDELQGTSCKTDKGRIMIELDASYALRPKNKDQKAGEFTLDVSSLAEIKGRYFLVSTTPALHLSMVDGEPIRRDWGQPVHGVRVSLNLDEHVYPVGSTIPLHIALENVDSRETISAADPYYDPPGVDLEVQDSAGHPISSRGGVVWLGHATCHSFLPGWVWPIELTLNEMGFPPDRPGGYTVVAGWHPILTDQCNAFATLNLADLVTVKSSPMTFRVVDSPPIPNVTIEKQIQ